MDNSKNRLDDLIDLLKNPSCKPVHEAVIDYEEAIVLAIASGRIEDSKHLIQKYLLYLEDPVPYEIEFFCCFYKGVSLWRDAEMETAGDQFKKCRKLAEKHDDSYSDARTCMSLGVLCYEKGDYKEAFALMEKSEQGLRSVGGDLFSRCLNWLGIIYSRLEQYQRAWVCYKEALEINEELSFKKNQGYVLCNMGLLCQRMGLVQQAEACFLDSIKIQKETGNTYGLADAMANLGVLLLNREGQYRQAESLLEKSAEMHLQNKAVSKAGYVLASKAVCMYKQGDLPEAEKLFDRAQELVFSNESWSEQVEYCAMRADVLLEMGDLNSAEKLVLQGREIQKTNLPGSGNKYFELVLPRLLFEKGDYKAAYLQLLEFIDESAKLDAVRAQAMESVIYSLIEVSRGKKELLRVESEAGFLEEKNRALQISEERFRGLINNMTNIGVLAVDSLGTVTFWNETCTALYGFEREEAFGKNLSDLIVPEHLVQWFSSFIRSGLKDREYEVNLRARDGNFVSVLLSLVPFKENETFIIQVDLTKQRIAENQRSLIEAQMRRTQKLEALGTLAGGIAHDFNNLLQGILGNAALLCKNISPDSPDLFKAQQIQSAAEKSADLCTQMLDYAGFKPVNHELIDLNHVVGDISTLIETSLSKDVELVLDLSNRVPFFMGDRPQMRQVIMNLVLNGAEAITGAGKVVISTDYVFRTREDFKDNLLEESPDDGDFVLLKVTDTGSGIDPIALTRIFDPFFSTKKTGRGLGLAAVLGIIRGHSGAITVNSEPGKGTEFRVYLRVASEEQQGEKVCPVLESGEEHIGKSILIVDDEEIVRSTILSILSSLGFKAEAVSGGAEALNLLEKGQIPDLMMLDLTMPGLNGAEVFKRLRSMGMEFPVLVMSGYSEDKLSSLFPDRGPDGFLQKPFSPDTLKVKLNSIFNSS